MDDFMTVYAAIRYNWDNWSLVGVGRFPDAARALCQKQEAEPLEWREAAGSNGKILIGYVPAEDCESEDEYQIERFVMAL